MADHMPHGVVGQTDITGTDEEEIQPYIANMTAIDQTFRPQ